ncbi:MAG TPA: PQQ-binding-like beta-propeller repeat protein [Candidatus Binatia bacterium]|jgi:outer membrane protein assembly factor BamB|nr:PQQ-binding-like beta-propeller repeat protein [Candidatus Binatia bacterium]
MRGIWQFRLSLFGVLAFAITSLNAEDWPQWLGPSRDSVWRESGILEKFPTNGPPVLWRAPIGAGYAGPAVADGRVYVSDRVLAQGSSNPADPFQRGTIPGSERILCLNEADGALIWHHDYDCPYTVSYPAGPRVMPQISQGKVYFLGAEGNLLCLDARTGKVIWSRDFKKDFDIGTPVWGFAGHPLLDGQRLICLAGGKGTTAVAFDKDTGKEIWRALTAKEPGYSSPMICEAGGKRQLIIWHPESANSLDPETGNLYWSEPFASRSGMTIATPRQQGQQLFFTTFYSGSLMLRLDAGQPTATSLWRTRKPSEKDTAHLNAVMCTPFLEDGYIYGVCSYGQLRCLKADTGERIWETFQATTSGDPVRWANAFIVKNGTRFFLFNEKGDLIIANLTPRGYQEVSRAHLLEPTNTAAGRDVVWSHPAFANRHLYARNDKELICVDLSARKW